MMSTAVSNLETSTLINPVSTTPVDFDPTRDLPAGFMDFFLPLHRRFTPRQQELAVRRVEVLQASLEGDKPKHQFPSDTVRNGWRITLPEWCRDQRNQMTGPADDAELVRQDAELGRARRDARPGRFLRQRVVSTTRRAWRTFWPACAANSAITTRNVTVPVTHQAERHGDLDATARTAPEPGRSDSGENSSPPRSSMLPDVFYSIDPAELKHPLCILHSEVRVGGRSAVVARSVPGSRPMARPAAQLHQVHGAGGVASAGVSDGRVRLQPARTHHRTEPGTLGLHGQPDPFQSRRSRLGAARSQHDSLQRCVLPEPARTDAGDLSSPRNSRDWRHDGSLSQPRRRRTECPRAGRPGKRQEERSRLPDGRRMDGTS